MNHPTRDADGDRRLLDAVYLPEDYDLVEPVWIELDSEAFHTAPLDVLDDRRREDRVRSALAQSEEGSVSGTLATEASAATPTEREEGAERSLRWSC